MYAVSKMKAVEPVDAIQRQIRSRATILQRSLHPWATLQDASHDGESELLPSCPLLIW